jgi:hypothetical protein
VNVTIYRGFHKVVNRTDTRELVIAQQYLEGLNISLIHLAGAPRPSMCARPMPRAARSIARSRTCKVSSSRPSGSRPPCTGCRALWRAWAALTRGLSPPRSMWMRASALARWRGGISRGRVAAAVPPMVARLRGAGCAGDRARSRSH